MNHYRQRKSQRASSILQDAFTLAIGPLDKSTTLQCQVPYRTQKHSFRCRFSHPLNCLLKPFQKRQKQALKVLLQYLYEDKIQETNIFWPKQLLKGDDEINSAYLNHIKNTRINSYIKTNIRSSSLSQSKRRDKEKLIGSQYNVEKKLPSHDNFSRINQSKNRSTQKKHSYRHQNRINLADQRQRNINENFYQTNHFNLTNQRNVKNSHYQTNLTNINQNRNQSNKGNRMNVQKFNSKENIKQYLGINQATTADDQSPQFSRTPEHRDEDRLNSIHETRRYVTNITNIKNTNKSVKSTSKSVKNMKKSSPKTDLTISVSYKNEKYTTDNPQNCKIYKVNLSKMKASKSNSKKAPIYYSNKTERHFAEDQSKIHGNESQSCNSMAMQMKIPHHISTYNNQILSQNYDRSIKNSRVSQMTNNADREQIYFYKENRSVKKERKVVYLDQDAQ